MDDILSKGASPVSPQVMANSGFLESVNTTLSGLNEFARSLPGSDIVLRYVKSSYQDDPFRTFLEILLAVFVIVFGLKSRTRADRGDNFIKLSEREINELVTEWQPEPLVPAMTSWDESELASAPTIIGPVGSKCKVVLHNTHGAKIGATEAEGGKACLNLASMNFAGFLEDKGLREKAVQILREYGVGSCGPPGFYGTIDVHIRLEHDLAMRIGHDAAIIYSQGFSTISSVIAAFCKRGDIIVADKALKFAAQKGIQISRSTIKWYDHNDMSHLEQILEETAKAQKKSKRPLKRQFIVTEGIFENDGSMCDLPRIIELKEKYKFRLMLDESFSFGTVGRTGRGMTELFNVPPKKVEMIIGSMANTLNGAGGFCSGAQEAIDHQRLGGPSFVFSASEPAMLATTASEALKIISDRPVIFNELQENIKTFRSVVDKIPTLTIPSDPRSPVIHLSIPEIKDGPPLSRLEEEKLLQDLVDECLTQGLLLTRARHMVSQEMFQTKPSIRIYMTVALTKKDIEKAAQIVKSAAGKVLKKR